MAEYVWTINIFNLRIGWLKHHSGWIFNRKPGWYLQIGKLDFYLH
jgi:hypothetical protein